MDEDRKQHIKESAKNKGKKALHFMFNPRFLLCVGIAWLITNGWSYIVFGLGTYNDIDWMKAVGGAYLAFLWLPISPEKLVTFTLAIFLLRLMFPNDHDTLGVLRDMRDSVKKKAKSIKENRKDKKENKNK